jgi:hypothetical protein
MDGVVLIWTAAAKLPLLILVVLIWSAAAKLPLLILDVAVFL